jgi:glycosyltransferase involved in cell wall biosynthesis
MKILYLNTSGVFGGAERSLLDIIASVGAARPDWELSLIAGSDGPLIERAQEMGFAATVAPIPESLAQIGDAGVDGPAGTQVGRLSLAASMARAASPTVLYARSLRRKINAFSPTVIHTNGFKMHLLGAWAAGAKTPVIWHVHDYVSTRPVMARLMRLEAHRCAAAIANSNSVADDLRAVCPDPSEASGAGRSSGAGRRARHRHFDITTVYNAVNLDQFNPDGNVAPLDELSGLAPPPAGTIRVGLVATFARWKGHEVFLRALAALPAGVSVRGYIIGAPVYQTRGSQYSMVELRALESQLGLAGRVGFTGFVDDVGAAMRSLDIVVHASTQPEPFGLSIAEAMACGRPVIASRAGGAAEIVEASGCALFHLPGDAADLANRIAQLAGDSAKRQCLGRAGRAAAERLFARPRLAQELIPIYKRVASARA